MPRLGGINIVGVVLATLAFYFVGFIFYGVIYSQEWTHQTLAYASGIELDTIRQMSAERLEKAWATRFPGFDQSATMAVGFVNSLFTVIILAIVLRQLTAAAPSLMANIGFAALLAVGFGLTSLAYDHIYAGKQMVIFWIDAGHTLVAYIIASAILSFFE